MRSVKNALPMKAGTENHAAPCSKNRSYMAALRCAPQGAMNHSRSAPRLHPMIGGLALLFPGFPAFVAAKFAHKRRDLLPVGSNAG